MEKRTVLALILCGVVLVIHMTFVVPRMRPKAPPHLGGADNVTVTKCDA